MAPFARQSKFLKTYLMDDQIPAKQMMKFPSTSAVCYVFNAMAHLIHYCIKDLDAMRVPSLVSNFSQWPVGVLQLKQSP